MAKPGPARRPALQVVREGNPGHRSYEDLEGGVTLPPEAPDEPDWLQWYPAVRKPTKKQLEAKYPLAMVEGSLVHITEDRKRAALAKARRRWLIAKDLEAAERARAVNQRARDVCRDEWRRIVPALDGQGLLTSVDVQVLADYVRVVARIDQCERDISEHGIWVQGERGAVKNPSTTAVNQLRSQLRFYIGELGLSPVARDGLNPRGRGGEDEVFD